MKNYIKKFLPIILIEYNQSNFIPIYECLKKQYNRYFYNFSKNKLIKISNSQLVNLKKGQILENIYKKNSVNIFFIKKSLNINYIIIQIICIFLTYVIISIEYFLNSYKPL